MPSLKEVNRQISRLKDADVFGTKKEIKYLPQILTKDEEILSLISGIMQKKTWLIVCTSKRIIFLDKGMFYGLKQSEIPLQKVNSIEQQSGFMLGQITVWYGSHRMVMTNIRKSSIINFVNCANKAIEYLRLEENNDSSGDGPGLSQELVADELMKLAKLHQQGILTDEEFHKMKTKLLS